MQHKPFSSEQESESSNASAGSFLPDNRSCSDTHKTLRQAASEKSSEANISAARRDDPPSQTLESGQAVDNRSQGKCETTMTERFDVGGCDCPTYPENLGPCAKYESGSNGRCVYCDHTESCHAKVRQAVDRQEWTPSKHHPSCTPNDRDLVWLCSQCGGHESAEYITDQLAAERQRREQEQCENDSKILSYITTHQADINYNNELKQKLLSAQAAIEKHNSDPMSEDCPLIEVDLSPLHRHDAEVRKPLAEALGECRKRLVNNSRHQNIIPMIDAALAQCKKKP